MKKIFRYLAILTATYVVVAAVSFKPQHFFGNSIEEKTAVAFQLVVAYEDNGNDLSLSAPLIKTHHAVGDDCVRVPVTSFDHTWIAVTSRQFIRFRNLRI